MAYTLYSNGNQYDVSSHTDFTCKMLAMSHSEAYGRALLVDQDTGEIMYEYKDGVLTYESVD